MIAESRTKAELLEENRALRARLAELERVEAERRETLQSPLQSEERFRQVLENIEEVFWLGEAGDARGIIYLSPAFEAIWGRKRRDVYEDARVLWAALHEEDRDRLAGTLQKHVEGGRECDVEFRIVRPDGSIRWLHARGFPVKDEDGRPCRTVGVARDITERKRAEEEIRRLARFPGEDPNPVLRVSADGTLIYANDSSRRLLEIWGCEVGEALPEPFRKLALHALESGVVGEIEMPTGDRVLSMTFAPCSGAGCVNLYGLDISHRKRAEEELKESHEQLRALGTQLARAEETERRRLARELHDRVGQGLTALGINLSALRRELSADATAGAVRRLDEAVAGVERIAECIRDVMADLRPPVLDDYGVGAALRWYGDRFAGRTGIYVEVRTPGWGRRAGRDTEMALFRIAQEALTNVAKHARAHRVTVTLDAAKPATRLIIADDGVGFDAASSGRPGERGGWGVMTMRERAMAVGGNLTVESEPGKGTRVVVEVPRDEAG